MSDAPPSSSWCLANVRVPLCLAPSLATATADAEGLVTATLEITGDEITDVRIHFADTALPEGQSIDGRGQLVLPTLLDAHVHLDKAHTWQRAPNRSGTFQEALDVLRNDKDNWTAEDLYRRANFALRSAWAYGSGAVRTHIDTGLPWAETSYEVMAQLAAEWQGRITLQTVSLCGVDQYASPEGEALADLPVRFGARALGGMPLMNPDLDAQLDTLMRLAAERNVGLDLHVDESGDPEARCLRAVAEAVLRNAFPYPVTCGHCCSLTVQPPDVQRETIARVAASGIHVIALPLCNLYLQDRPIDDEPYTPRWRGLTLIQEMRAAGITVACASDNIRDAFYAYGDLDMLEVLTQSIRLAHLDRDLSTAVEVATTAPARIMQLPQSGVLTNGARADLLMVEARSWSELLARPRTPRQRVVDGTMQTLTPPSYDELG